MQNKWGLWCLCVLGFLKEFRPSESFLTEYLVGPWKKFSVEEINQEIYPVGTYSTLLLLIIVFLITDLLCYKPVIILHGVAGIMCYCLIIFGTSKGSVQFAEVFYGLFVASEVAYSTYMYASCEKEMYQKVTSYTRIALQAGRLVSGFLGQLLISCEFLNIHKLNFLSLTGLSCSTIFGFVLPSTKTSLYFHRSVPVEPGASNEAEIKDINAVVAHDPVGNLMGNNDEDLEVVRQYEIDKRIFPDRSAEAYEPLSGFRKIWRDFHGAYSDMYVVKWSIWWALAHSGYLQVTSYIQNLWKDTVNITGGHLYNGAASATYTIFSILASWLVGQMKFDCAEKKRHWLLSGCAAFSGFLIVISALSNVLLVQYVAYGIFKILYQVMMILANSEVAKSLSGDSHGLVFGFNTFIALVLQTILTIVVTGQGGLQLSTRLQFLVYGGYYIAIGCGFGLIAIVISVQDCLPLHTSHRPQAVPIERNILAL